MEKNPLLLENEFLLRELEKAGIKISDELSFNSSCWGDGDKAES